MNSTFVFYNFNFFLTSKDIRKPTPDTVQELDDDGYQIYCFKKDGAERIRKNDMYSERKTKFNCTFSDFKQEDLFSHKRKFTMACERPAIAKIQSQEFFYRNYTDPVKFTTDNLVTFNLAFVMKRNSVFYKNFRDVLQRLFESGIYQQVRGLSFFTKTGRRDDDAYVSFFTPYNRKKSNVVLSFNYLQAGFIIWAMAVGVSVLAFIGEIICSKKELLKQKITEKIMKNGQATSQINSRFRKISRNKRTTFFKKKVLQSKLTAKAR